VKDVLRDLLPPVLWRTLRRLWVALKSGSHPLEEWEYIPEGWAYAEMHPEVKGWNVSDILKVYKHKWPEFVAMVEGTGPLGIAHESGLRTHADINSHNTIMSFAYAITLAARHSESLAMLDWGGGIGHYYLLAKTLLPDVRIEYHCKDVPLLAEHGAQLFPDQHFYTDESCLERTYDFVMASSSLHYTEGWQSLLAGLAKATRDYLYITRLPTVLQAQSFVFIQRPYTYGYNTEYLGWCLNRAVFLREAEKLGLTLVREFVIAERPFIANAPEQCQNRGFLLRSPKQMV
jgi:putative methyltransferase (TIGR04325 family)